MNRYSIILSVAVLLFCLPVEAQYKKNKTRYNPRAYVYKSGDRYIPALAGFCSLPVPGLGQAISGEPIRGLAFLGGSVGCICIALYGSAMGIGGIESGVTEGQGLINTGLIGFVALDIWAIIDASRVAKVNNLAFRDQNKTSVSVKFNPCINTIVNNFKDTHHPGISMQITF